MNLEQDDEFEVDGAATLVEWLGRAGQPQGIQPEDVTRPSPDVIVVGRTGVSIFWKEGPRPCWQVREAYDILGGDGERRPVSRLVASLPPDDLVAVLRAALILVFERSLDIEISMLE